MTAAEQASQSAIVPIPGTPEAIPERNVTGKELTRCELRYGGLLGSGVMRMKWSAEELVTSWTPVSGDWAQRTRWTDPSR